MLTLETLTESETVWSGVCCREFPTLRVILALPKSFKEGFLPSSCHETVQFSPPVQVVLRTGAVRYGFAKTEGKTAVKANKRVAARIVKVGNESVGKREWVGLKNSWHEKR